MLKAQIAVQRATLAAIKAAFNDAIRPQTNAAITLLNANRVTLDSAPLSAASGKFAAVVTALNASSAVLRQAILDTDALVPTDPPVPVPPVPVIGLGATNQRTGMHYDGLAGLYVALGAALDGDTILIAPGVYKPFAVGLTKTLVLKSAVAGKRYVFDAGGNTANRVIELGMGVGLTIEDAELCGNKQDWGNAAGIWPTGGVYNLIVRRCVFHDLNNGIMAGEHPTGTVLVEDSEAYDNGDFEGYGHNFYLGRVASFTIRRTFVHAVRKRGDPGVENWTLSWGHLIKSRAEVTLIEDCRLFMGHGEANRCVDLPNGGDVTIRRTLMEYRTPQNGGVGQVISYGVEEAYIPQTLKMHQLTVENCTIVNRAGNDANTIWVSAETPPAVYSWVGNIFSGPNMPSAKGDPKWAIPREGNRVVPLTAFSDLEQYDLSLLPEPWKSLVEPPLGFLDGVTTDGIVMGWVLDHDDKTAPCVVQVYIDGPAGIGALLPGSSVAVIRSDINTAYRIAGNHGFAVPIPDKYRDGKPHAVYVYGLAANDPTVTVLLNQCPGSFTLGPGTVPVAPTAAWTPARDASGRITNFDELPARTWTAIPGTAMESTIKPLLDAGGYTLYRAGDSGLGAIMDNYSGMAWDFDSGRGWAYGGGHHGGTDNGIYQIDLNTMRWSIYSYPSHPDNDFSREQLAYYTGGARHGGVGVPSVHVYPLKESSTGFAIKADQAYSSKRWFAVTGPERDVTDTSPVFQNGDTWAQAGTHPVEYTFGGTQNCALFDGRPVSMHTYNGFVAVKGLPVLLTRAYWGTKADGTGWIRYPAAGAGVEPTLLSGENVWVQTDEKTGKVWWGGCGSSCWANGYYFYSAGYVLDVATWEDAPTPRLLPDNIYAAGTSQMLCNAGDLMTFSFKAGRKIGGICSTGYGWTFDLDTGARQLLFMSGNVYSGNKGEGRSLAYLPHLGQTWVFDTSVSSCPVWEVDIDSAKAGGPNGALTVDCRPVAMANAGALPSNRNGLTYSRLSFWPAQRLIVYFPTTTDSCWVARVP